mgnify:CR=1 FL=1
MRHFQLTRPFNFFDEIDKNFDNYFTSTTERAWKPTSRVEEKENFYLLTLDIPGVDKEHLKVELEDNVLSIAGERKDRFKNENEELNTFASFSQRYSLPKEINQDEIEVHQDNGVLDIILPKTQKKQISKTIEVKSGKSQLLT